MKALISQDHRNYQNIENATCNKLSTLLHEHGYIVLPSNIILNISQWNKTYKNKSFVLILVTDISWNKSFIVSLEKIAIEFNNKFTLITDNISISKFMKNYQSKYLKILFIKEFYGFYHISSIQTSKIQYKKLYNCFFQRTDHFRLLLFNKLYENDLLNDGYVSCLGMQTDDFMSKYNINSRHDVFSFLINEHPTLFSIDINNLPYKNFDEPSYLNDIENKTKFSIIYETYNSSNEFDNDFLLFTEKTMRGLQVGNIPLVLNSNNTSHILQSILNLKLHPINFILDKMPDRYSQIEFIVGLLQNDFIDDSIAHSNAIHNRKVIKEYYNTLHSSIFYENILQEII